MSFVAAGDVPTVPMSSDDEPTDGPSGPSPLDDHVTSLLDSIEKERIPERLLKLAKQLQDELQLRRQKRMN